MGRIFFIIQINYVLLFNVVYTEKATECSIDSCSVENSCKCASAESPLTIEETPQLVSVTFTELIDYSVNDQFVQPLLSDRKNPDGAPISFTFFLTHEYTDYAVVHDLYVKGQEIAVQSISNNLEKHYWKVAPEETLAQEFGGMKKIISKFANIPDGDIKGVRTPLFQLSGNLTYHAYLDSGFTYDSSWPTALQYPLFPYTLDYQTTQKCREGIFCPTESFPAFWELPINSLQGQYIECYNVSACNMAGDYMWISEWFQRELNRTREGNREPLTLVIDTNWFIDHTMGNNYWRGFNDFLDHALNYTDTFFVSQSQVINWMKNPVSIQDYSSQSPERTRDCNAVTCVLQFEELDEKRYMKSCTECPEIYPWVGNPEGLEKKQKL